MDNRLSAIHARLLASNELEGLEKILFPILKVISVLFESVARLRVLLYQRGILSQYRSSLPVISVGNLSVGGTGKTPVCDYILKLLKKQGVKAAVLSRGYGGKYSGSSGLVSDGTQILMSTSDCGDEPLLLAQSNPDVVVVVARRRADGLRFIEENFQVDLVLLDDGFQHLQVHRDLDIVLLDAERPFGNGYSLPAGNLREPRSALSRADLILYTRYNGISLSADNFAVPSLFCRYRLSDRITSLDGNSLHLSKLNSVKPILFAGIAYPESFFNAVRQKGVQVGECIGLSDHVEYTCEVLRKIQGTADSDSIFLTTEKDAVKLKADNFTVPCYVAELEIELDNPSLIAEMVRAVMKRKGDAVSLKKELLEILACPKCKGNVRLQETDAVETIICDSCALAYPVRDNIPVMLIDEAQALNG